MINKDDMDYVMVIDGQEGSGKSALSSQVASYVDPSFNESRMCLTPRDFMEGITSAKKGQAVIFDESFTGLGSRYALSEVNKLMIQMMMEMRKKNLFVILNIPSVFYLEKYVCLHRARALLHVYMKNGKRGRYLIYNQSKLKQLYLKGKKNMSYSWPKVKTLPQRFPKATPVDWKKYEDKKISALKQKKYGIMAEKQMEQRDALIYMMRNSLNITEKEILGMFSKLGVQIAEQTVNDAYFRFKRAPEREDYQKNLPDEPNPTPQNDKMIESQEKNKKPDGEQPIYAQKILTYPQNRPGPAVNTIYTYVSTPKTRLNIKHI